MTLPVQVEIAAVQLGSDGVARVGGTRVTLDSVIYAFQQGATAEEIAQQYPALKLADVYGVITYYLHFQADVDAYLDQRRQQIARVRQENEARFDVAGIRERLLARQQNTD